VYQEGLLQLLPIPKWNWTDIAMDFTVELLEITQEKSSIFVIIDCLSKQVHFIPSHNIASTSATAQLFLDHIYHLHEIPKTITLDHNGWFVSNFWQELFKILRTKLNLFSSRHSQTDKQTEQTIKTFKNYLKAFIKYNQKDWNLLLLLVEFTYNSAQHSSTKISSFQIVYYQQSHTLAILVGT
jgi:hypothetical protein